MTHTLRGAEKGVGQIDKQSRAEHLCAWRRAPNRAGTYCWCPGFCHTERKCHHLSNNENWKQFPSARKRQAEREKEGRERGKQWGKERASAACAEIRFLSWFCCHCLHHQPCTTSFHTQALEPERAAAPPPPLLIYLPPPLLSRVMFIFNAAW